MKYIKMFLNSERRFYFVKKETPEGTPTIPQGLIKRIKRKLRIPPILRYRQMFLKS